MQETPHSLHAHLGRDISILAFPSQAGDAKVRWEPFSSIGLPQQEHDGASDTASLPGTESMRGGVGYLLDDVSISSVRTASLSSPV